LKKQGNFDSGRSFELKNATSGRRDREGAWREKGTLEEQLSGCHHRRGSESVLADAWVDACPVGRAKSFF